MKGLLIVLGLLWGAQSRAELVPLVIPMGGDGAGNGGDVIECANGSHEMLDLYEARMLRGLDFDDKVLAKTPEETAYRILDRLAKVDPKLASYYKDRIRDFRGNARFVPDANLVDIPDSFQIVLPRNCELRQAAIQRTPQFPEERLFTVDKTIWDKMSVRDQAALMLHEVIYKTTLDHAQQNSIKARYFNSYISSKYFPSLGQQDYLELKARASLMDFWTMSPVRYLTVHINEGLNVTDRAARACSALGLKLAFFQNDQALTDIYENFGDAIQYNHGDGTSFDVAYLGTNGHGQTVQLGAVFGEKWFYDTDNGAAAMYSVCQPWQQGEKQ